MVVLKARPRLIPALLALVLGSCRLAVAQEKFLNDSNVPEAGARGLTVAGPSGGLMIPNGRILADGSAAFGINNYLDPNFARANRGENYLFALGFLPNVEISGRLTNFGASHGSVFENTVLQRDISANLKFAVPRLFAFQPDIVAGLNDLGGGASFYRSRYIAASYPFGPLYATLGVARSPVISPNGSSAPDGVFGGAELPLGQSGFALLAEHSRGVNSAGLRYASPAIASLANMQVVGTVQRSFGARESNGNGFDRTVLGLAVVVPFRDNARSYKVALKSAEAVAFANLPVGATAAAPAGDAALVRETAATTAASSLPSLNAPVSPQSLQSLQSALEKVGLERVRVGMTGSKLVIEYENHRYNRNEVDAIGIAFGLGARLAPEPVKRIHVVTKKAGLAMVETIVDRAGFLNFLVNADPREVAPGFRSEMRPVEDHGVEWFSSAEGPRGYSRVVVKPVVNTLVGTEFGLFDYSLAASTAAFVPLWKGAEVSVDYLSHLSDSDTVRNGPYGSSRLRSGVRSALLSQALWLGPAILNVTSVGKLQYDYTGVQNETTLFVPGRDDQVRVEYSRLRLSEPFFKESRVAAGAFYQLRYQPLDLWVEAGYNRYVANDHGPSLRVSRWFGDLEAQAYARRSDLGTFVGFQLAFPLTPRQGMRPGITQLEGTNRFGYALESRLVRRASGPGNANYVNNAGIAEGIPLAYSSQNMLLNRGRVGEDYLASELPRMREAALLFAPLQ
jgi:hypothetical protein